MTGKVIDDIGYNNKRVQFDNGRVASIRNEFIESASESSEGGFDPEEFHEDSKPHHSMEKIDWLKSA